MCLIKKNTAMSVQVTQNIIITLTILWNNFPDILFLTNVLSLIKLILLRKSQKDPVAWISIDAVI